MCVYMLCVLYMHTYALSSFHGHHMCGDEANAVVVVAATSIQVPEYSM